MRLFPHSIPGAKKRKVEKGDAAPVKAAKMPKGRRWLCAIVWWGTEEGKRAGAAARACGGHWDRQKVVGGCGRLCGGAPELPRRVLACFYFSWKYFYSEYASLFRGDDPSRSGNLSAASCCLRRARALLGLCSKCIQRHNYASRILLSACSKFLRSPIE